MKICDDNVSCDAIKTEVIPLELYETGKMICFDSLSIQFYGVNKSATFNKDWF